MSEHRFRINNIVRKRSQQSPDTVKCRVCHASVVRRNYTRHLKSKDHQNNLRAEASSSSRDADQNIGAIGNHSQNFDVNDGGDIGWKEYDDQMEVDFDCSIEYIRTVEDQHAMNASEDDSSSSNEDHCSESATDEEDVGQFDDRDIQSTEMATEFISSRFRAIASTGSEADVESTAHHDAETLSGMIPIWEATGVEWCHSVDGSYPFVTPQNLVMQALVNGDDDQISRRQLKKILYAMNLILKLKEDAMNDHKQFNLPKLDNIWNFQTRKGNDLPVMETTVKKTDVKIKDKTTGVEKTEEREIYMNLPSEHLKLLTADPKKAKYLTLLPDRTPDQSIGLQQGQKWREHPSFQHPMLTEAGIDYWVGDVIISETNDLFLVKSFFTKNEIRFAEGYQVIENASCLGFTPNVTELPVSVFVGIFEKFIDIDMCVSLGGNGCLDEAHKSLLIRENPLKVNKKNENGEPIANEFYKVKVSPITLFSDDYSGNMSKQHNPFESWSMTCAAMPFGMRTKRENTFFVWTGPNKSGVNALSIIPFIVDDLKEMETGKLMFSAEDNEMVLVTAPLIFILADNPAHSDICGILGLTTVFPCRKCYFRNHKKKKNESYNVSIDMLNRNYNRRTKEDYIAASHDEKAIIEDAVEYPLAADLLSYRNLGSERLLELDSYDPAQDTPVEILHTILLGVAKYLVNHLIKVTLAKSQSKMDLLILGLKRYAECKSYSRPFSKKLRHCGSFLGRDYKQLLQILPVILSAYFSDHVEDQNIILINKPLVKLGFLCSLVFVRQMNSHFNDYVNEVSKAVDELITEVYHFDIKIANNTPYSCKPKMHLLRHLRDDLVRFGCALHFETEKGEQFNKFLREHLFHTNRQNPSKDLAIKFGKQEVLRHLINGGSWVSKKKKRVKFGRDIERFISSVGHGFFEQMFGESREFTDNNYTGIKKITKGVCGVFEYEVDLTVSTFIGEVIDIDEGVPKKITLQKYALHTIDGNYICKKIELIETFPIHKLVPKGALDMFMKDSNGDPIINMNKFGTVMLLKSNIFV